MSRRLSLLLFTVVAGLVAGESPPPTGSGQTFADYLAAGGSILIILALLSMAMLALVFERVAHLRRRYVVPAGLAEEASGLWHNHRYEDIRSLVAAQPSTLGRIIRTLVDYRETGSTELSTLAGDIASADIRAHVHALIGFALIATIAPLLGLMGTIIGMIGAFQTVSVVGSLGDASMLAEDISHALVTTAAGLVVAVPAIACHHLFKARTNKLALQLDRQANALMAEWFLLRSDDQRSATGEVTAEAD